MRLSASRTLQLEQYLAAFHLVHNIGEPPVTPSASDLDLRDGRHVGPPYRARASSRSTKRTKLSIGWAPEISSPLMKKAGVPLTPRRPPSSMSFCTRSLGFALTMH